MGAVSDMPKCTRIAPSTGRRCGRTRTWWPHPTLPDPLSCGPHWTRDERAALAVWRATLPPAPPVHDPWSAAPLAEPACWSWLVTDEVRALLQRHRDESPDTIGLMTYARLFHDAMTLYDQGRCAICGLRGNPIEDHDHDTGLTRGWLCRGCNASEGLNRDPGGIYGLYRRRYPLLILGVEQRYSGWGWENGTPTDGRLWRARRRRRGGTIRTGWRPEP